MHTPLTETLDDISIFKKRNMYFVKKKKREIDRHMLKEENFFE